MANEIEPKIAQDDAGATKPSYQQPVLTELDIAETAAGVVRGTPENSSYIS